MAPVADPSLLRALVDRCETEEASRWLDALIEQAISPDKILLFDAGPLGLMRGPLRDFPMDGWEGESTWEAVAMEVGAQRYTSNLIAARSLSDWVLICASDIGGGRPALVVLGSRADFPLVEATGFGRTLELAWCAASLRARAVDAEMELATLPVADIHHPQQPLEAEPKERT